MRDLLSRGDSSPAVALALVASIVAGVMTRDYLRLRQTDLGFEPRGLVAMQVLLPQEYANPDQRAGFFRQLQRRLASIPGVHGVCASTTLPLFGQLPRVAFEADRPLSPGMGPGTMAVNAVSPDFFQVMKIPLRSGRDFAESDDDSAPRVILISVDVARQLWPGADPIGKRMRIGNARTSSEIIGVVDDVRQSVSEVSEPQVYVSIFQTTPVAGRQMRIAVRTSTDAGAVRNALSSIDSRVSVTDMTTLEEQLSRARSRPRFKMLLGNSVAGALFLLATAMYLKAARNRRRQRAPQGPTSCPACGHGFTPPRVTLVSDAIAARYGPHPIQCPSCGHIWSR